TTDKRSHFYVYVGTYLELDGIVMVLLLTFVLSVCFLVSSGTSRSPQSLAQYSMVQMQTQIPVP
uniref:Uncharacterized protein n=1 Tax=Sus scrofa TaxID=9823 RepID=A0A8D1AX30_PIG